MSFNSNYRFDILHSLFEEKGKEIIGGVEISPHICKTDLDCLFCCIYKRFYDFYFHFFDFWLNFHFYNSFSLNCSINSQLPRTSAKTRRYPLYNGCTNLNKCIRRKESSLLIKIHNHIIHCLCTLCQGIVRVIQFR